VRRPLVILALLLLVGVGCGKSIEVSKSDTRLREGAQLFKDRCSGCHSLDAAAAVGSKTKRQVTGGERTNGPNFNSRHESKDDVLFAIRNGGFSGAIMPANIVVGDDAEKVAEFLEAYSGKDKPAK
jgi:mono/diheme cytochrome c family protein